MMLKCLPKHISNIKFLLTQQNDVLYISTGQLDTHGNLKTFQTISKTGGNVNQLCWHPSINSSLGLVGEDKVVEIWDVKGMIDLPTCSSSYITSPPLSTFFLCLKAAVYACVPTIYYIISIYSSSSGAILNV